jgi:hypothetical protein
VQATVDRQPQPAPAEHVAQPVTASRRPRRTASRRNRSSASGRAPNMCEVDIMRSCGSPDPKGARGSYDG